MAMTKYTDSDPGQGSPPSGGGPGGVPGGPGGSAPGGGLPGGPGGPGAPAPYPPMGSGTSDVPETLVDLNARFKGTAPALFRDDVVLQTMGALISKKKPNPLLKGGAGVGKTQIVEDIARRIADGDPLVPPRLRKSTVYELPISHLVAGAGIVGQLEERVVEIVDFATDPKNDAILFIDEVHVLLSDRDPTYSKISQILKPPLARGDMRLIAATTAQEARAFDDDPAFSRRFQHLVVDELTREQSIEILRAAKPSYVSHYGARVAVPDQLLEQIAVLADEHARFDQHRPDTGLTLLDRSMADAVVAHARAIADAEARGDAQMVQILKGMAATPLNEAMVERVAKKLMTGNAAPKAWTEDQLRAALTGIKGQDEALDQVVSALVRDQLQVFPRTKPLTLLLPGPSGVGKTETAKVVAQALTGEAPILLNMTEYTHSYDTAKIMGSAPGLVGSTSNKEKPFDALEANPYRVILLDEMEKAHRDVHRLFMAAFDEGSIRTAQGSPIDFSKCIIMVTTNAGREAISKPATGFQIGGQPQRLSPERLTKALQEAFEPEFLGRFQAIVGYDPIERDVFSQIVHAAYAREKSRIDAEHPRIGALLPQAMPDDEAARIVAEAYLPDLGARPAGSAVRRWIEDSVVAGRAQRPQYVVQPAVGASDQGADPDDQDHGSGLDSSAAYQAPPAGDDEDPARGLSVEP